MALIDLVKERTGTELSDAALEAMIAGIGAEIDALIGPSGPVELVLGDAQDELRWKRIVTLPQALDPAEPVEIVEIDPAHRSDPDSEVALNPADYRVLHGGRTLQRLTSGPNGNMYWAPLVRVSYTPLGSQAARDEVIIKIMQLDLSYRGGLKSERAGDYQFTLGADAAGERNALLASLKPGGGMVMA